MTSRTRRQHTVSRFYLRGFATAEGRIQRIHLSGEPAIVTNTANASVINDFYSIPLDGKLSDYFEREFAALEGPASSSLAAIEAGTWPLEFDQKADLAAWIALQALRVERQRSSIGHTRAEMIRLIVGSSGKEQLRNHIEQALGRSVDDEELDAEWTDLTKPGGPDLEPDSLPHIALVSEMWPALAAYFLASHWTLIRFKRRSLVTSDNPVTMSAHPASSPFDGVGWFSAGAILVPLTRHLALVIRPMEDLAENVSTRFAEEFGPDWPVPGSDFEDPVPDVVISGTTSIARGLNRQTISQAHIHVYTHPDDSLDSKLELPAPGRPTVRLEAADGMIREEGFWPDGFESVGPDLPGGSVGIRLADIPWPILGRRVPSAGEASGSDF